MFRLSTKDATSCSNSSVVATTLSELSISNRNGSKSSCVSFGSGCVTLDVPGRALSTSDCSVVARELHNA